MYIFFNSIDIMPDFHSQTLLSVLVTNFIICRCSQFTEIVHLSKIPGISLTTKCQFGTRPLNRSWKKHEHSTMKSKKQEATAINRISSSNDRCSTD